LLYLAGFWFSFSAVAVIFISLSNEKTVDDEKKSIFNRLSFVLKSWLKLQLLISVFLLPLSLYMFQQGSLVSPLANLLLIPYVSFLVVPVVLFAIVVSFISHDISDQLFNLSAMLLDSIWPVLSLLSAQPYAFWVQGDVKIIELLLATAAMLLLYYSRRCISFVLAKISANPFQLRNSVIVLWLFRCLTCLLIIPLFVSDKSLLNQGEYQLTILDVGQGSAAVIRTQHHVAVFDAGAKFSDKLDTGSGIVIPYLRSQGIKQLDRLIISHGDADHIGGAPAILEFYPDIEVIGQDLANLNTENKKLCREGDSWRWDGVDFIFLSPAGEPLSTSGGKKRNNRSCVLRVSSESGSVLFSGDIEKKVEMQLVEKYGDNMATDVLIVPHHGSNTSSTLSFIQTVSPEVSVISAGYRNRYKLPGKKVLSRYEQSGYKLMKTDKTGAISIKMTVADDMHIEHYRQLAQKYWHHRLN
jgi:competence protein ComEC